MQTRILPVDPYSLGLAEKIISDGGVVAFPTETVYGLGADATNPEAVRSIFSIKGRPSDNPLIAHVHKNFELKKLVEHVPDYSKLLTKAFLPGPLTMVYKSRGAVCPEVSCGLNTLAVRIPSHPDAQRFLERVDIPIAAPSANLSRHVSPVTAAHVYDDLKGKIPLILDGGRCTGGIESTVLDCTGATPCVLRSGLVSREMIAAVVGECDEYVIKEGERVRSPGMKYKHYSPKCRTKLYSFERAEEAYRDYKESKESGIKVYIMCDAAAAEKFEGADILNLGESDLQIASNLYEKLREGERVAEYLIAVAPQNQSGVMVGVMNRLTKACK